MKSIPNNKYYSATKCGNIICNTSNKVLKTYNCGGYLRVYLLKTKKQMAVHRLVAMTYIKNTESKPIVNHKNGIKNDNRLENLEWMTHKENTEHAISNGLMNVKNENHGNASLILDTQTGVFYECLKNLCELYGFKYTTMSSKLNGWMKNNTQFIKI